MTFPTQLEAQHRDNGQYQLSIGAALAHALAQALMFAWCLLEARIAGFLCLLLAAVLFLRPLLSPPSQR